MCECRYRQAKQEGRKKLKLALKLKKSCSKILNKKFGCGICGEADRVGKVPKEGKGARDRQVCVYGRRVRNVRASLPAATPSLFLRENVVAETPTSEWMRQTG